MIKKFCDVCEKELYGWEDDSGRLEVVMLQSSSNKLANLKRFSNGNYQRCVIKIEALCVDCQRRFSEALYKTLSKIID